MNLDLQKLARFKADLQAFVELAEKVPAEKWKVSKNPKGTFIRKDDPYSVGVPTDICRLWNSTALEANAAFIAQARTMGPMGCKAILAEIIAHEEHARTGYGPLSEYCKTRLTTILNNYVA